MDFNFDLNLVQSQKLLLTPQLKQALEILRMNSQDLFEYVCEQVENNPVLEYADELDGFDNENFEATIEQVQWMNRKRNNMEYNGQADENIDDINEMAVDNLTIRSSLKEHLMFQLHTSGLGEELIIAGEYLIHNTDENGYLLVDLVEASAYLNISLLKVKKVLKCLQSFDPPGICARNLMECLLIQIEQAGLHDENLVTIVRNHLNDLASNKISAVAKKTGLQLQKVAEIFDYIKTLDPKPGRAFYNNYEIKYIVPDIIVKVVKNKFEVMINEDSIPLININEYYKKIIDDDLPYETKKFIRDRIDNAVWLIKCIEQRKKTLRKVAECIVSRQSEFFKKGKKHIRSLTMKSVANEVDMHESTVSRTVNGKFIQCLWGIFEMKYFFTNKLKKQSGEEISSENVKMRLIEIIRKEDKKHPLSDDGIAGILTEEGIQISRRTVAKYRAEAGIPPLSGRRRY